MLFLNASVENIGIVDAGIVALLGYAVVFVGLIALMGVVVAMGKIFQSIEQKNKAAAAAKVSNPSPVLAAANTASEPVAPGAAGALKLHDVEPKTAAMLMAIVADKMGKPLNELRFLSIKEVK